jgi:hypothetical protein
MVENPLLCVVEGISVRCSTLIVSVGFSTDIQIPISPSSSVIGLRASDGIDGHLVDEVHLFKCVRLILELFE